MLTDLQKKTAQAIVNIFETGKPQGEYSQVTLLRNDPGHLTYGRSQTTLASGNLYLLIKDYCETSGAQCANDLQQYLTRLQQRDLSLDNDANLRNLLKKAGGDPVMHAVQDQFFDRVYWVPSETDANALGITSPLGVAVVYDSHIHGSWKRMRDRTIEQFGQASDIGEQTWVTRYVDVRRNWLATHPNPLLQKTVYRMDAFRTLINAGNWSLNLPLTVRGVTLDESVLGGGPPVRVSAQDVEERLLVLRTPFMQGSDVKEVQEALRQAGIQVSTDGVFGNQTAAALKQFQASKGMKADGIVGPATRAALGIH